MNEKLLQACTTGDNVFSSRPQLKANPMGSGTNRRHDIKDVPGITPRSGGGDMHDIISIMTAYAVATAVASALPLNTPKTIGVVLHFIRNDGMQNVGISPVMPKIAPQMA